MEPNGHCIIWEDWPEMDIVCVGLDEVMDLCAFEEKLRDESDEVL
jgi:hypothetical protein